MPGRIFAILLPLLLTACAPAARRDAPHAHPTIVSLNPCTDAVLAEVADPAQILAISHYSADPEASSLGVDQARRFRTVSGSVEEVLALRPDIIVGDRFIAPATSRAFERLGLRLERFPIDASVEGSEAQVLRLAALAGHPERGEALVRRMRAALAAAAPPPGAAPVPAVVWQAGGMVPGEGTLIADLLRRTGFAQLSAVRGLRQGEILPLEALLADPPRVVLATGNVLSNENRGLAHPALRSLAGTRLEPIEPNLLWCGGPTVVRAAERLGGIRSSLLARAAGKIEPYGSSPVRGGGSPAGADGGVSTPAGTPLHHPSGGPPPPMGEDLEAAR